MVLPLLAAIGARAATLAPRLLPLTAKVVKFFAAKPIKRIALPLVAIPFLKASPTALKTAIRGPKGLTEIGTKLGTEFETRVEKQVVKEPKGAVQKALEVGGVAGIAGAAAILGAKKLRERRAREI